MNREESSKICLGLIPEKRRDKLAALKKAIREGTYKVKAEDIAGKIIMGRLFELALTAYNHKYQNCVPGRIFHFDNLVSSHEH